MRLIARRAAPLGALVALAALSALAAWGQPGRQEIAEVSPLFQEQVTAARTLTSGAGWLFGLMLTALLTVGAAARIPDGWFRGEGDWLGVTPAPRSRIVRSTLVGLALGALAFVSLMGLVAVTAADADGSEALELGLVAGPMGSLVLMPGDAFEQDLPPGSHAQGERVRVRVTPTLGGEGPTSAARIEVGGEATEQLVARRSWLELDGPRGRFEVRVKNTGDGALAVLGPRAVEVWRPSSALAGGHVRMAGHAALLLLFLGALALGLGSWMGPGIAAALALALWLALRMALPPIGAGEWLPGGSSLAAALAALAEGRHPSPVSAGAIGATAAALLLGFAATRAALGPWRRDSRGG